MVTLRRTATVLALGLSLAYPVAVYFGLRNFEPRGLGLILLLILLLRHGPAVRRFAGGMAGAEWLLLAGLGGLAAGIVAFNSRTLLLLYPALVNAALLLAFARSLVRPPTVIERIARLSEPDLPPAGVRYTRRVTQAWCLFFLVNGSLSVATIFASLEWWTLYNGLLSYLLMGTLFAVEWLVRGRVRRHQAC